MHLGEEYFVREMPDTTLALLARFEQSMRWDNPQYASYYHILGRAALASGDTVSAVAWLGRVAEDNREESRLYAESARRLLETLEQNSR